MPRFVSPQTETYQKIKSCSSGFVIPKQDQRICNPRKQQLQFSEKEIKTFEVSKASKVRQVPPKVSPLDA